MTKRIPSPLTTEVRAITGEDGGAWFVAKDVCEVLELANVSQALMALDSDEKDDINISGANNDSGRLRKHRIISEPGLYKLTFRSTKPEAKRLTKWVTSEVLPRSERPAPSMPSAAALGATIRPFSRPSKVKLSPPQLNPSNRRL